MKQAFLEGDYIIANFSGHDFTNSKNIIKNLPRFERFYDGRKGVWKVHNNIDNIKYLRKHNFDISSELFYRTVPPLTFPWRDIIIPEKYNFLRPYQKECLQFLLFQNGRGLLSLDVGLGKTLTSLAFLDMTQAFPALIISLPIVKDHWKAEYEEWFGKNKIIKTLSGYDSIRQFDDKYDIVISNIEILRHHMDAVSDRESFYTTELYKPNSQILQFKRNKFKTIIFDESHMLQDPTSKNVGVTRFISQGIPNAVFLTGTPVINKPAEFYSTVNLIRPDIFSDYYSYMHRYCGPQLFMNGTKKLWSFKGSTNEAELQYILRGNVMVRYLKTDVEDQLPYKQRIVIPLELTNYEEYKILNEEIEAKIEEGDKTVVLTKYETLKQKAFELKVPSIIEWIDEKLETTDKIVIFGWNKEAINILYEHYKKISTKIVGETSEVNKKKNKEKFINDPNCHLLFGNFKSLGTGANGLQKVCNVVAYIQLPWHSSQIEQCTGRIWRKGQVNGIMEFFLIAPKTIEEDIIKLIDDKNKMNTSLIDGKKVKSVDLLTLIYQRHKRIAKMKRERGLSDNN